MILSEDGVYSINVSYLPGPALKMSFNLFLKSSLVFMDLIKLNFIVLTYSFFSLGL